MQHEGYPSSALCTPLQASCFCLPLLHFAPPTHLPTPGSRGAAQLGGTCCKHTCLCAQVGETVDIYEDDVWWWAVVTEMLPKSVRVSRLGESGQGLRSCKHAARAPMRAHPYTHRSHTSTHTHVHTNTHARTARVHASTRQGWCTSMQACARALLKQAWLLQCKPEKGSMKV